MAARTKTPDKIEEAKSILSVWNANPEFKLKDLTLTRYQADYDRLAALIQQIESQETSLMALRNERDDLSLTINSNTTRVRSGIKGYFGVNSTEYEQAGGTRSSERKKTTRKTTPTTKDSA
jgi:hypothetical protein